MLTALCDPRAYPHPADEVVHLHTHISDIFLAGNYAYKVKKPVNFGFLDFTTLARRCRACEDEVRLNSRLAPQIYLAVVPISISDARYCIGDTRPHADSTIVDYAVQMVRLPDDGMLDHVAATGVLRREHMLDIARQIARFHDSAEHGPAIDRDGGIEVIAHHIRQNFSQTEKYIGRSITSAQFDHLRSYSEDFMHENASVFAARVAAKRVVDGHGDLHLRNMCLHHGAVVIFDCIEFNRQFRATDVIGDIAFVTMDLDARALPHLGNFFLNAYLENTGDYVGLAVLDFYQVYRACVRGKVASFLIDADGTATEREAAAADAAAHFQLAQNYTSRHCGGIVITCGLSASGKTTVARQVAEAMGGITIRSDAMRKQLAGVALQEHHFGSYQEGIYRADMTENTYHALLQNASYVLASGRWAILDATYSRRSQRLAVAALAQSLGVTFGIIHCNAPMPELERRLDRRQLAHEDISDATRMVLNEQQRDFEPPLQGEGMIFSWSGSENFRPWLADLSATRLKPVSSS